MDKQKQIYNLQFTIQGKEIQEKILGTRGGR